MKNDMGAVMEKENVLAGAVGALLFSLVGGALWFVLYQVGFLAGISGLIGVICAIKGYSIFAKKESLKGIVIAIIAAVIVMLAAWYLCLSLDVYNTYKEWYADGEIDYTISFAAAVRGSYVFLEEPDIALAYLKDLIIGLVLCVVGAFRFVANAVMRVKQEKKAAQNRIETQFSVQPEMYSQAQPGMQPQTYQQVQPETQPQMYTQVQPETQPQMYTQVQPETQSQMYTQVQPETQSEE
ncbi:MAG: hypothetical protein J1E34_04810 [Oscillospiraceae bacterium]|nr:hypothetical protein [Oscillospiraceae bacterium]